MKIRIELYQEQEDDEVIIRCRELNDTVKRIQDAIASFAGTKRTIVLYHGEVECYVDVEDILFFETMSNGMTAHTRDNVYQAKYRLYELEEMLPGYFLRISKSAIINVREVFSLSRSNLSTTSVVAFSQSNKQVFVSRHYIGQLKEKLKEMRMR